MIGLIALFVLGASQQPLLGIFVRIDFGAFVTAGAFAVGMFSARLTELGIGRPYIGARVQELGRQGGGLEVVEIHAGSPSDHAGLEIGDVITNLDGAPIDFVDELNALVGKMSVGQEVELIVTREGESVPRTIMLTVGRT